MLTYLIVLFITKISKNALFRVPDTEEGRENMEMKLREEREILENRN